MPFAYLVGEMLYVRMLGNSKWEEFVQVMKKLRYKNTKKGLAPLASFFSNFALIL